MASSNFIHPTLQKLLDETTTDFISRYLSVVQFNAPAANNVMKFIAGKNGYTKYACSIESTTRASGGILGIDVIERIIVKRFGQQILEDYAAHVGNGIQVEQLSDAQALEALRLSNQVHYIELPSRQGWSQAQHDALNHALIEHCRTVKGMVYQNANACFIIKSHHSNGCKTALGRFINNLANTNIDVQQYVSSLLNATAKTKATSKHLTDSLQSDGVVVAHYNFSLPIGKDENGVDIYLPDAGTDGGSIITVTDHNINEGQSRFFIIDDLFNDKPNRVSGMFKGFTARALVKIDPDTGEIFTPAKPGYDNPSLKAVMLEDVNKPKCQAKNVLDMKNYDTGIARIIDSEVYGWFIVDVTNSERISFSFQETPYHEASYKPDVLEYNRDAWQRWNQLSEKDSDALAKLFPKVDRSFFNDARCLLNNPSSAISRIATTNGMTEELETKKVRGNDRLPLGVTIIGANGRKGKLNFTTQTWEVPADMRLQKVVHKRYPIIYPWALTVNMALTIPKLKSLVEGKMLVKTDINKVDLRNCTKDQLVTLKGIGGKLAETILEWRKDNSVDLHNLTDIPFITDKLLSKNQDLILTKSDLDNLYHLAEDKEKKAFDDLNELYQWCQQKAVERLLPADKKYCHKHLASLKAFKARLNELVVSLSAVPSTAFNATCFVSPQDGIDRNEDHDGDSTVCDTNPHWVKIYSAVEAEWVKANKVRNELPKKSQIKWDDPSNDFLLINIDGVSSLHPKGMKFFNMCDDVSFYTNTQSSKLRKCVEALSVDPQGPTGLFSNVGIEVFSRIHWKEGEEKTKTLSNGYTWTYKEKVPKDTISEKLFKLFVVIGACIQLSIDWQKRAYRLMILENYEDMYEALLQGKDRFEDHLADMQSEMQVGKRKLPVLAANRCYNPEVVYGWVRDCFDSIYDTKVYNGVCEWKQSRDGSFKWCKFDGDHNFALSVYNESKFKDSLKSLKPFVEGVESWLVNKSESMIDSLSSAIDMNNISSNDLEVFVNSFGLVHHQMALYFSEIETIKLSKVNAIKKLKFILRTYGITVDDLVDSVQGNHRFNLVSGNIHFSNLDLNGFLWILSNQKRSHKSEATLCEIVLEGLVKHLTLNDVEEGDAWLLTEADTQIGHLVRYAYAQVGLTLNGFIPCNGFHWRDVWKMWSLLADVVKTAESTYSNQILAYINKLDEMDKNFSDAACDVAFMKYQKVLATCLFMANNSRGNVLLRDNTRLMKAVPHYWNIKNISVENRDKWLLKNGTLPDGTVNYQTKSDAVKKYHVLSNMFQSQHPNGVYHNSFLRNGALVPVASKTVAWVTLDALLRQGHLVSSRSCGIPTLRNSEVFEFYFNTQNMTDRNRFWKNVGKAKPVAYNSCLFLLEDIYCPISDWNKVHYICELSALVNKTFLLQFMRDFFELNPNLNRQLTFNGFMNEYHAWITSVQEDLPNVHVPDKDCYDACISANSSLFVANNPNWDRTWSLIPNQNLFTKYSGSKLLKQLKYHYYFLREIKGFASDYYSFKR